MKTRILLCALIGSLTSWAQSSQDNLTTAVDSLSIQIGAQLNYTLQLKADKTDQVLFAEKTSFLPFEIIFDFPLDTLKAQSHYLYTKLW